jgi:hypothetical protein
MQSITAVHPVKLNVEFNDGRREKFHVVAWTKDSEDVDPMPWVIYDGNVWSRLQLALDSDVSKTFLTADGE